VSASSSVGGFRLTPTRPAEHDEIEYAALPVTRRIQPMNQRRFQNGSRWSRFSTVAAPDKGSGVSRNSTERGHL
jgi:hypothetical protein